MGTVCKALKTSRVTLLPKNEIMKKEHACLTVAASIFKRSVFAQFVNLDESVSQLRVKKMELIGLTVVLCWSNFGENMRSLGLPVTYPTSIPTWNPYSTRIGTLVEPL